MRQTRGGRTCSLYSSKMQLEEVCRRKTWHNWTLCGFMDTNSPIYSQEDASSHSLCRSDLQLSHLGPSTKGGGRVQKCDTQINMYTGKKGCEEEYIYTSVEPTCSPAGKPGTVLLFSHKLVFLLVTTLQIWLRCRGTHNISPLIVIPGLQGFDMTAVIWRRKCAPTWQKAAVLYVCFMVKY